MEGRVYFKFTYFSVYGSSFAFLLDIVWIDDSYSLYSSYGSLELSYLRGLLSAEGALYSVSANCAAAVRYSRDRLYAEFSG